jgi:hypothetical protein
MNQILIHQSFFNKPVPNRFFVPEAPLVGPFAAFAFGPVSGCKRWLKQHEQMLLFFLPEKRIGQRASFAESFFSYRSE